MNTSTPFKSLLTRSLITGWTAAVLGLGSGGCQYLQTAEGQGTGVGALIGGAVGLGVGALFKDQKTGMALGLLVGAGVGALVGNQVGKAVEEKRKKHATEEKFIDAQVKEAREKRQAVVALNDTLKTDIANLRRQQSVNNTLAAQQAKDLQAKSKVDEVLTGLNNDIKINTEALRTSKSDPTHTAALKDEVARLEKERDELTNRRNELLGIQGKSAT